MADTLWRPSRRELFYLGIGGAVAAVPFARRSPLSLVRRHVLTMGTIAEFAVAHRDPRRAEAAIDEAARALFFVDAAMSRFKPDSDVGRANLRASKAPISIGAHTRTVLVEGLWWADASGGGFDPCIGGATSLWDVGRRTAPPAGPEVSRFANRRLYAALELSTHAGADVVRLHDPDAAIDLGGIAKGYAVDLAADALRRSGIEHALVGAGGDLYAMGRSPAGEPWQIGIQAPDDPRGIAATLRLENAAVATSGDYQQYFEFKSRRYHHLLDPSTGEPWQSRRRSVSVVAGTCMAADAGATLAFGSNAADAARVLTRRGARIAHSL